VSELARIADQLQRAYRGEAWHGPSIREVLDGVDADAASARPVANAHTIRELVVHIVVWEQEALARLAGKGRDDLPPEEDWPRGAAAWADLLDELDAAHQRLTSAISELDAEAGPGDAALDETVAGSPQTVYHLLHGVIQHNLYHAGQMAILKKALTIGRVRSGYGERAAAGAGEGDTASRAGESARGEDAVST